MTLEAESEGKKLADWFTNLILYFRKEYEKVPEEEKKHGIDTYADYSSPCQIEVFWLKSPEIQLIFKSNFRNRPDMEIIIHGPYDSHEFLRNVEPIVNEPRWSEANVGSRFHFVDRPRTLSFVLASHLHRVVEVAKMLHFLPSLRQGRGMGQLVGDSMWAEEYNGNIANMDFVTVANEKLQDTRRRAQEIKKNSEAKGEPKIEPPRPQNPKGYGVYFFPPIILGERPQLTPLDVLYGRRNDIPVMSFFHDGFKFEFGKHTTVVNEDGFMFLPISDKETALKAFNVIMAVGMLRGFGFLAVREHELSVVEYNKETMRAGGMTYDPDVTMRTRLFNERYGESTGYKRKEISEATLRSMIAEAGKIFDEAKYAEELRLLSESYTHLNDAEYAPSFVMSWSIIERHASKLWKKRVDEKELDEERTSKLLNTNYWTMDYLLEVLNMNGDITEDEYDKFMEMKSKRNRFIHRGKQIASEDAERCFNIAKEIVTQKMN